jgi:hypothetical protein
MLEHPPVAGRLDATDVGAAARGLKVDLVVPGRVRAVDRGEAGKAVLVSQRGQLVVPDVGERRGWRDVRPIAWDAQVAEHARGLDVAHDDAGVRRTAVPADPVALPGAGRDGHGSDRRVRHGRAGEDGRERGDTAQEG